MSDNEYRKDSDSEVGGHGDNAIGNWRIDYEVGVETVSWLITVPVIGWWTALKDSDEDEADAP